MGRSPCCDKANVKKGPWSPEEDAKLKAYIEQHGTGGNWIALPQKMGLKRCGKSCRLRWLNYLRPNIKHGGFSEEEDDIICSLYVSIGSRWSIIAAQLPGRTDNDIKNYWNTRLKKKLLGKQRKEQQAQAHRVKQDIIMKMKRESESENLVLPLNQTPNWASQLSVPIQEPYNSNTIDSSHYPYHISFPLSQPQDPLFPTSINNNLINSSNIINTNSCQSTYVFEGLNEWSELVCVNNPPPQQVDAALQGNYYGMGSTGSASTESSSWGDITSNLLYSSLLPEYEDCQQGLMPQEVAFHNESGYFGMHSS